MLASTSPYTATAADSRRRFSRGVTPATLVLAVAVLAAVYVLGLALTLVNFHDSEAPSQPLGDIAADIRRTLTEQSADTARPPAASDTASVRVPITLASNQDGLPSFTQDDDSLESVLSRYVAHHREALSVYRAGGLNAFYQRGYRFLTIHPWGGLGNRMLPAASGLLLALLTNRVLLVDWTANHVRTRPSELFNTSVFDWDLASVSELAAQTGAQRDDRAEYRQECPPNSPHIRNLPIDALACNDADAEWNTNIRVLDLHFNQYFIPLLLHNPHYRKRIERWVGVRFNDAPSLFDHRRVSSASASDIETLQQSLCTRLIAQLFQPSQSVWTAVMAGRTKLVNRWSHSKDYTLTDTGTVFVSIGLQVRLFPGLRHYTDSTIKAFFDCAQAQSAGIVSAVKASGDAREVVVLYHLSTDDQTTRVIEQCRSVFGYRCGYLSDDFDANTLSGDRPDVSEMNQLAGLAEMILLGLHHGLVVTMSSTYGYMAAAYTQFANFAPLPATRVLGTSATSGAWLAKWHAGVSQIQVTEISGVDEWPKYGAHTGTRLALSQHSVSGFDSASGSSGSEINACVWRGLEPCAQMFDTWLPMIQSCRAPHVYDMTLC